MKDYYAITWELEVVSLGKCSTFDEADDAASEKNIEAMYVTTKDNLLEFCDRIVSTLSRNK